MWLEPLSEIGNLVSAIDEGEQESFFVFVFDASTASVAKSNSIIWGGYMYLSFARASSDLVLVSGF